MRTKTLLLAALLSAAGVATSMGQSVFSVNAVGYVNVVLQPGFSIINNPLDTGSNTVANILGTPPEGTTVYRFAGGSFTINSFTFGSWSTPGDIINPGEGFFIFNPQSGATGSFTNTFVGTVMQGSLSTPIPAGFSIKGSQVPQAGQLDTILGYPAAEGDIIYQFNPTNQQYGSSAFGFGAWSPAPPVVNVAEGFWVSKTAPTNWTRTFSVNQ